MKVLHSRLDGSAGLFDGSVESFCHFSHAGTPLDRLTLVSADENEVKALDAAGYEWAYDCEACAFTSYGQRPAPECLIGGCAKVRASE